jgi:hypothetical protein
LMFKNSEAGFGKIATVTSSLSITLPADCANNPMERKRKNVMTKSFIFEIDLLKYIK